MLFYLRYLSIGCTGIYVTTHEKAKGIHSQVLAETVDTLYVNYFLFENNSLSMGRGYEDMQLYSRYNHKRVRGYVLTIMQDIM